MPPFNIAALLSSVELNDMLIVYKYVFTFLLSTTEDALFYSFRESGESHTLLFLYIYILLIEATARERAVFLMCCKYYCDVSTCLITKEQSLYCDFSNLAHIPRLIPCVFA